MSSLTRSELRDRAREFRKAPTGGEALLWVALRARRLRFRIRRQHVIGPFIADFCCPERKLVIEVDGPVHDGLAARDAGRDAYLEHRRYRVLRLADELVRADMETAIERIADALEAPPPEASPTALCGGSRG